MDGQSVKTTEGGGIRGFDAHKRVKGRKRHILVETLGAADHPTNLLLCEPAWEKQRRRGLGITPAVMKGCHWVEPILVCQIKFTEWTEDGQLRQPVFLGLRTDKAGKNVVRD